MAEAGWREVVFKPVVSGAAMAHLPGEPRHLAVHEAIFARCLAAEAMMVQAFQPAILPRASCR